MTFGYLTWYAARDLTARTARSATLVVVAAVAAATGFAVVGFGFVDGVARAETSRLLRDPLAMCVFAGDRSYGIGGNLGPADVPAAGGRVRAAVGNPDLIRGVYPIRHLVLEFEPRPGRKVELPGRTIALGADPDPLPESRPVAHGRWFTPAETDGIVLTPSAIQSLGLEGPPVPPEVTVVYRGRPVPIPVVGVTRDDLPNPIHRFIIPEPVVRRIAAAAHPDPETAEAQSGPVPDEWLTEFGGLVEPVREAMTAVFPNGEFTWRVAEEGKTVLKLATTLPPAGERLAARRVLARSEWGKKLEVVRAAVRAGLPDAPGFAAPFAHAPARSGEDESGLTDPVYNMLAVYTTGVPALRPTADALGGYVMATGQPLRVDRGVVDQLAKIGEQSAMYRSGMNWVAGVMAAVFTGLVWFVFIIRAEQQVAEFGMLKAMGMNQLGRLAVIQGVMVGAAGGATGGVAGAAVVGVVAGLFYPGDPLAVQDAADVGGRLPAAACATAVVACAGAAWLATGRARRMSPAAAVATIN